MFPSKETDNYLRHYFCTIANMCIWKIHYSYILGFETHSILATLINIWDELIHTLRNQGQWRKKKAGFPCSKGILAFRSFCLLKTFLDSTSP